MNKQLIMQLGAQFNDPFRHLYFEPDMENGGRGKVFHPDGFRWSRAKSNRMVQKLGFSYFLALHIWDGHIDDLDCGRYYLFSGYPFENRDTAMIRIKGKWGMNRSKDVSWVNFISAEEVFGVKTIFDIDIRESIFGLKQDPGYEARCEEVSRNQHRVKWRKK